MDELMPDEEIHCDFKISELIKDPVMCEIVKAELRSIDPDHEILRAIEAAERKLSNG